MRVGLKVTKTGTTPTQAAHITQDKIRAVSRVTTEQVWAPAARRRCPRKTGRLRRSIKWRLKKSGKGITSGSVFPTARSEGGKPYGIYIEWGTRPFSYTTAVGRSGFNMGIDVGTPKRPRKSWKALRQRGELGSGQTMPFVRAAWKLDTEKVYREVLKQSLSYKRTGVSLLRILRTLARQAKRAAG